MTAQKQRLTPTVRHQQRLTLTPQVRQTIEMLSMPMVELQQRVRQELVENPALEELDEVAEEDAVAGDEADPEANDESDDDADDDLGDDLGDRTNEAPGASVETGGEGGAEPSAAAAPPEPPTPEPAPEKDAMGEIETFDFFAENYENTGGLALAEEPPTLERTLPASRTLSEHLREQLGLAVSGERERAIGLQLIGNLDERGYLDGSVGDLAAALSVPESEVEAVRQRLLAFDPTGCGALDLRECLLAQIRALPEETGPDSARLERIVRDHLEVVMKERFGLVAEALGVDAEEVLRLVRRIGEMSFRPGETFSSVPADRVIPDARAYRFNGEWRVEMNEGIPRFRPSPAFREILRASGRYTDEERKFARDAWIRANGFRRSVQQRQETVRLVAEDIVKKQADFLDEGIDRIRPLVLNDVARDIGRAESTVSRVVSNKYLQTPRGVVPFRRFFHSALALRDGRQVSSEAVRARVKRIVEREDPEFPLADEQIVQLLDREGIIIARRTVAKYRKALRIPSSNDRRARHRYRHGGRKRSRTG